MSQSIRDIVRGFFVVGLPTLAIAVTIFIYVGVCVFLSEWLFNSPKPGALVALGLGAAAFFILIFLWAGEDARRKKEVR